LEQALSAPVIVEPPAFLAIPEALAMIAVVLLQGFALGLVVSVPFTSLVSLPFFYSLSSFYPTLLSYHTIVLLNLAGVLTP